MDALQFAVQWLHVLGGVFWFGATLYVNVMLIPATRHMSAETRRDFGRATASAPRTMVNIGALTVLFGFLRGTVFGPVRSVELLLGTAYGITWLSALALGVGLVGYSRFVIEPFVVGLREAPPAGATADALVARARRLFGLELLLFFALFTLMILMRFGL